MIMPIFSKRKLKRLHHKPRWMVDQTKKRRKITGLLTKTIFLIIFILIIGLGLALIARFTQKSSFENQGNFNVSVLAGDKLYILSYHNNPALLNVLLIEPDVYAPLAKGFGEYRIKAIWELGEMEKFGGGELLQLSSQYFLGAPIQGWAKVNDNPLYIAGDINTIPKRQILFLLAKIFFSSSTNIHKLDILKLISCVNSLPQTNIEFYSLDQTRAGEKITLPDQTSAYRIQKDFLENLGKQLFRDNSVIDDTIIWGVVNTTNEPGMADTVARLIHTIGGEVIMENVADTSLQGGIYCAKQSFCESYSAKLFSNIFRLPLKIQNTTVVNAEALIVLDTSFFKTFYSRF